MPIFGSNRDFKFIQRINYEYIEKVIEQEVGYYKISLPDTDSNIYGESDKKIYNQPVLLYCLITSQPPNPEVESKLPSVSKGTLFCFIRERLKDKNILPEIGDIIEWNDEMYEVFNLIENEFFLGKKPEYSYSEDNDTYGGSVSIKLETKKINIEKLNIRETKI